MKKQNINDEKITRLKEVQADKIYRQIGSTYSLNQGNESIIVEKQSLQKNMKVAEGFKISDIQNNESGIQYIQRVLIQSNIIDSKNSERHKIKLLSTSNGNIIHAVITDNIGHIAVDSLKNSREYDNEDNLIYKNDKFLDKTIKFKDEHSIEISIKDFKKIYIDNIDAVCLNFEHQRNNILNDKMVNINSIALLNQFKDPAGVIGALKVRNDICNKYIANQSEIHKPTDPKLNDIISNKSNQNIEEKRIKNKLKIN